MFGLIALLVHLVIDLAIVAYAYAVVQRRNLIAEREKRILEAEGEAHRRSLASLQRKLSKAKQAEKEATELTSRVLAPLETLRDELLAKIKDQPAEKSPDCGESGDCFI